MSAVDAPLFPLFLKLAGRPVLLVGGGEVARAKAEGLLAARAALTVVAPQVSPALREALASAGAQLHQREFVPADLDGVWLVVAAAPAAVNRQVLAAAEPRHLFVNSVDDPEAATAYGAAVVRKGPVTLAISTGGAAPALAGLLRESLAALLPEDLSRWGQVADQARQRWKAEGRPMAARRPLLLAALNELYETPPVPATATATATATAKGPR
jgi:uroporphyrin-III C-methyltransferase/precorrin-2 dehydrogenase/sirohydrochlorin ferrochelatase